LARLRNPQQTLQSAVSCFQAGDLGGAAAHCGTLLQSLPKEPNALHILGAVRLRQKDPETAVRLLTTAHEAAPKNAEVLINLGAALCGCNKPVQAAEILHEDGNHTDSLVAYEALDALEPDNPQTLNAIGALHAGQGRLNTAEEYVRRAQTLDPHDCDVAINLGNILATGFRVDDALNLYRQALLSSPDNPDLLCNIGNALSHSGDSKGAAENYTRALEIDPEHIDARASLANSLLANGDYRDGWEHFLKRTSTRPIAQRLYRTPFAQDLSEKPVVVLADQGLGDQIFFARFLTTLKRRGAHVVFRPDARLSDMLVRSGIADEIVGEAHASDGNYIVSAGDLPFLLAEFRKTDTPSAFAIPAHDMALRNKLDAFGPPPWIGVTRRAGTPNLKRALMKEAPAARLASALEGIKGTIVTIQRNAPDEEIDRFSAALGRPVLDLSDTNNDIEDSLALSGLLDRYVGVSNTMTHLRAARGRCSDVLVPTPAEFRWMNRGDSSPWFPGCRIFRQSFDGDWGPAFTRLVEITGA
jgi:Tfp pilus assembly protein PilF